MNIDEPEDLSYLSNIDNSPEPEEEEIAAVEPEEDAEAEETEAEPEAEGEDESEEEAAPAVARKGETEGEQPRRQRAETRVQKLANEKNQEREARIRAEAERDALLKFRHATPAPDNSEAIRARSEKLSVMEPHERAIFLQGEQLAEMNHKLFLQELRSEDRADKAAYEAKAIVDPRYARNKDAVEKELQELRAKGINATREQCLVQVVGRKVLTEKPRKGAREAAAQRVASTKGKPTSARSNPVEVAGKGDGLADLESRLRGKSFNQMFNN